jgi:hypothetical protein
MRPGTLCVPGRMHVHNPACGLGELGIDPNTGGYRVKRTDLTARRCAPWTPGCARGTRGTRLPEFDYVRDGAEIYRRSFAIIRVSLSWPATRKPPRCAT